MGDQLVISVARRARRFWLREAREHLRRARHETSSEQRATYLQWAAEDRARARACTDGPAAVDLRALTFVQPWGTAALSVKPVENRSFPPPKALIGKRFAVHAGARFDKKDEWGLKRWLKGIDLGEVHQSALLGTVELAGFVRITSGRVDGFGLTGEETYAALASHWRAADARYLWVLREPRVLEEPIPCKGMLGLWRVPSEHVAALLAADGRPFVIQEAARG